MKSSSGPNCQSAVLHRCAVESALGKYPQIYSEKWDSMEVCRLIMTVCLFTPFSLSSGSIPRLLFPEIKLKLKGKS
jgi:hypothetical protein